MYGSRRHNDQVHDEHTYRNAMVATLQRKIVALGGITHNLQCSRLMLYQLSYGGSSAGCVEITHTNQHKAKQSKCLNSQT